ncbi:polygalacturonase [Marchantia polymorpha subsp. ruderalis]
MGSTSFLLSLLLISQQLRTSNVSVHSSSAFTGNVTMSPHAPKSPVSRIPPRPPSPSPPPPPATMSPAPAPSSPSNSTAPAPSSPSNSTAQAPEVSTGTTNSSAAPEPGVSDTSSNMTEFNVLEYGALGDGVTNDTQAFADAWKAACAVDYAYVHAPVGYSFLVYPTTFKGPCLLNMTFKVDGTVLAPPETSVWNGTSVKDHWLEFSKVSMIIQGTGTIDGQGQNWWAESCKTNSSNACKDGPTAIVFNACTNVTVKYVTILNSQQMHLAFEKSVGIMVNSINISAPGDSPNTDGIHLQNATSVTIKNSFIGTGDDCVSIQNGSSSVTIKNITCGPGHGISVGGLGKKNTSATVSNIVVEDVVFTNSTNGVRIKSWQGSSGTASTFTYQNLVMNNVKNPILIDQYYCDSASSGSCPNFTSNVQISDITFKNITGTSATKVAVKLACSETVACTGITLQDIDLVRTSGSDATSFCSDAYGVSADTVIPSSCLLTSS